MKHTQEPGTGRALVLTGYGINADEELALAFELAGAPARRVHITDLLAEPATLAGYGYLGIPGGFSFGDHLGSGLVLAQLFRDRLAGELAAFVADGGMVVGICNGFQTLVKSGLLPAIDPAHRPGGQSGGRVSLVHNDHGRFINDWVQVSVPSQSRCLWTAGLEPRWLPIRHGEGRLVADGPETLDALEATDQVALRYHQANPNGSANDIAGLCDATGRILGLMPHPEAFLHAENHPHHRHGFLGGLGLDLFKQAVAWRRANPA